jgi:hypothetical protein
VKRYRAKDGTERLWYGDDEIEEIMLAELAKFGLMPTLDEPVLRVEDFIERHLRVQFESDADLPAEVLGETEFRVGARLRIKINRDLTGAALDDEDSPLSILGRYRATAAHESSHVIPHRCLFNLTEKQGSLFEVTGAEAAPEEPRTVALQRCFKRNVLFRGTVSDWREVQANKGMAALLMPKGLFVELAGRELAKLPGERADLGSAQALVVAGLLGESFKVSRQAALIRLETLNLLATPGQVTLF